MNQTVKRTPSPQQASIFKFIQEGQGNAAIDAKAGTGKTTTVVDALQYIPQSKRVAFCAFSKAIVEELSSRVPSSVRLATLHSHGLWAVKKVYGRGVKIEADKKAIICNPYIEQVLEGSDLEAEERAEFITNVFKCISIGKQNLTHDPSEITRLARKQGIELVAHEAGCVKQCMIMLDARQDIIDFDDMVYLPAAYSKFPIEQYDYLFVDEAQDMNKAQLALVRKMFNPNRGGRLIAVGDPQQAIFGFAGSDEESFANITRLQNTQVLPLSVSYRCAKDIIKYVRSITGVDIDYYDKSPLGSVNENASIQDIRDGHMVICRNTAPLVSLCMKFITEKKAAYIRGRDIGDMLANQIKKYVPKSAINEENGFEFLYSKIDADMKKLLNKLRLKGLTESQAVDSPAVVNLMDRKECYMALRDDSKTPQEMIDNITRIFNNSNNGGIQLTTAHRSKGLEAEHVHIVEDGLLHGNRVKNEFQKTQENNLRYVAYTRAKKSLNIITDWEFYQKKHKNNNNDKR